MNETKDFYFASLSIQTLYQSPLKDCIFNTRSMDQQAVRVMTLEVLGKYFIMLVHI